MASHCWSRASEGLAMTSHMARHGRPWPAMAGQGLAAAKSRLRAGRYQPHGHGHGWQWQAMSGHGWPIETDMLRRPIETDMFRTVTDMADETTKVSNKKKVTKNRKCQKTQLHFTLPLGRVESSLAHNQSSLMTFCRCQDKQSSSTSESQ